MAQLAVMGLVTGVLAGGIVVLFRLVVEMSQAAYLPGGAADAFASLDPWLRLVVATLGGLLVGLIFHQLAPRNRQVGIVHVIERLAYHQAHLPLRNMVLQFIGGALSLASGHSVGREGPSVHLGAAAGSQLGLGIGLPNNSIRTLVGCGSAAAIAASFNTPIAGVIFAMEVILMEYTIAGFMPVILAAVAGAVVSQMVFGADTTFSVPTVAMHSLWELPWLVVIGLVLGLVAALFIHLVNTSSTWLHNHPFWLRTTLAGALTGVLALFIPQVMGSGYDTVDAILVGDIGLQLLLGIALLKLLASTLGLGLGLPGGLIGPTLVIGAAVGGALGLIGAELHPELASSPGFYAMIGMGAMMSATLQAPLAGLMALLELTGNPGIILPGMLTIVVANLLARELFHQESIFMALLHSRGLDYRNDAVAQAQRRIGVAALMERNFLESPRFVSRRAARDFLDLEPHWILIQGDAAEHPPQALLPAADLRAALAREEEESGEKNEDPESDDLDLMAIPAQRRELAPIGQQATAQEGIEVLRSSQAGALYILRAVPGKKRLPVYGVLTRERLEQDYGPL